jgi:hypothetical protein
MERSMPGCALGQSFDTVDPDLGLDLNDLGGAGMPRIGYDTDTPCGVGRLNLGCFAAAAFTAA